VKSVWRGVYTNKATLKSTFETIDHGSRVTTSNKMCVLIGNSTT